MALPQVSMTQFHLNVQYMNNLLPLPEYVQKKMLNSLTRIVYLINEEIDEKQ